MYGNRPSGRQLLQWRSRQSWPSPPFNEALECLGPLVRDVDLARHHVMAEAAELVANDAEPAHLRRRERDDVLVAGMDLNVDVGWLQRESVLPIDGGEVDSIADTLLQLQDRPPLPQPAKQVD